MPRATLKACLEALANASPNGSGFSGADLEWGMKMARQLHPESAWSPRTRWYVYDMVKKYRRQLVAYGLDFGEIVAPPETAPPPRMISPSVAGAVRAATSRKVELINKWHFVLSFSHDQQITEAIKLLPNRLRRWDTEQKWWHVRFSGAIEGKSIVDFSALLQNFNFDQKEDIIGEITEILAEAMKQEKEREAAFQQSFALGANIQIPGLVGTLRSFQNAGAAYGIQKKRAFIADEMGLGKTPQSIAIVEHEIAYPAIYVVRACLRLNWLKELRTWVPGRNITLDPQDMRYAIMHALVISYEGLVKHYPLLEEIDWKAIVLDESQAIKNNAAKRTQAAKDLAKVSKAPIRLCLTGTPVDICPYEFAPQLTFLGRMNDMGGPEYFFEYYCQSDRYGAAHLEELNAKLRRHCYIRREKKDVLKELPEKSRSFVPLELDNEKVYRQAENDVIGWLRGEVAAKRGLELSENDMHTDVEEEDAVDRAERAPHLYRIAALKKLAMQGMLAAAKDWIEDFLESGEKLVVFCHHIEAQQSVYELFKDCAVWTRAHTGTQWAVEQFQSNPKIKVIVCSLKADNAGHTLTAASNVVFLERMWTSTIHDQAEDRTHRIGQRSAVMAWYLYPRGTIYEKIDQLIEERRELVKAMTSGGPIVKSNIMKDLIQRMTAA